MRKRNLLDSSLITLVLACISTLSVILTCFPSVIICILNWYHMLFPTYGMVMVAMNVPDYRQVYLFSSATILAVMLFFLFRHNPKPGIKPAMNIFFLAAILGHAAVWAIISIYEALIY